MFPGGTAFKEDSVYIEESNDTAAIIHFTTANKKDDHLYSSVIIYIVPQGSTNFDDVIAQSGTFTVHVRSKNDNGLIHDDD